MAQRDPKAEGAYRAQVAQAQREVAQAQGTGGPDLLDELARFTNLDHSVTIGISPFHTPKVKYTGPDDVVMLQFDGLAELLHFKHRIDRAIAAELHL